MKVTLGLYVKSAIYTEKFGVRVMQNRDIIPVHLVERIGLMYYG